MVTPLLPIDDSSLYQPMLGRTTPPFDRGKGPKLLAVQRTDETSTRAVRIERSSPTLAITACSGRCRH